MLNIFKTFKENKKLLEENKKLKAQNEALAQFRKSFDDFYNDISGVKTIVRQSRDVITLKGFYTLNDANIHYPTDECKRCIAEDLSEQLMPFIEFDVVDNRAYNTKDIIGRLQVLSR